MDAAGSLTPVLRAGVAVFDEGHHHAAHDAWEPTWLDLESGTDDERLLHGLIQYTAAVHHAAHENWAGVGGLAESASGYLADLPADYRAINVGAVRTFLREVADDPEHAARVDPPALTHRGEALSLGDLDAPAALVAAPALAEALDYDEETVERAVAYARAELDGEGGRDGGPFLALVVDFVREAKTRPLVYRRLAARVQRRRSRAEDVEGLFE